MIEGRGGTRPVGGPSGVEIDALLREAVAAEASDLHLSAEAPPMLRVQGELIRQGEQVLSAATAERALAALAPAGVLARLAAVGEVDFSYSLPGVGRFRVAAYRQRGSVCLAIRPIPSRIPDLDELGAPPIAAGWARQRSGLVLIAGRAGAGKSTTLAAMVEAINRERSAHVIALEDPVEYLHRHKRSLVHQREIGVDSADFPQALRAAMRQNPDVIVVGEVREAETAASVLLAAETGHLVLATVRQPDCARSLDFLVELFPTAQQSQVAWQLAGVLEGAMAQVLLPRRDGAGRAAVFEVLVGTPAVRTLIRDGKRPQLPALLRTGVRHGMRTLDQAWRELVARGVLDGDEPPPFPLPPSAGG